jgi:ribosome-associated protein
MIRSLVKVAEETMISKFQIKSKVMGAPGNGWVVVDFNDIVLHIFSPKQREYYKLEELWNIGKTLLRVK